MRDRKAQGMRASEEVLVHTYIYATHITTAYWRLKITNPACNGTISQIPGLSPSCNPPISNGLGLDAFQRSHSYPQRSRTHFSPAMTLPVMVSF